MDPTSLIASIVTIIGAGGTVGKGLRKLAQVRHAPQILIQLKEQVSDLHLLIEVTSDLTRKHHTVTAASSDSCALRGLERIKNTTLALERLIVYDLTIIKNSKGLTEIDKLAWVQSQFRVRDLKAQIQADMQYLSTSLNLNVYASSRIFLSELARLTAQDPFPLTRYKIPLTRYKIKEPLFVQLRAHDGI